MTIITEANRSSTNEAFLTLLTFTGKNGNSYFVNNNENVVSRGVTYVAYPFSIILNGDDGESAPEIQITIDAVDQQIIQLVRELIDPPDVVVELVLSSTPNTVEKKIDFLTMSNVRYDALTVTATLKPNDFLRLPAIDSTYNGFEFPDLIS